jgi:hypothetical protein
VRLQALLAAACSLLQMLLLLLLLEMCQALTATCWA